MNWNQLSPQQQQQQYLMAVLMGHQGAGVQPVGDVVPFGGGTANEISYRPGQPGLSNPLMTGGNSAVNPQQQAQMMQYLQMLQSPQGFGATANGNIPVWQMLMGRSPVYGQGGAVA